MTKAQEIEQALETVAHDYHVRILYACESGSRAWGFPSATSDYDVRFIYVYPRDRYLGVCEPHQQITRAVGDLDIEGWDLRKALLLLRKMNPSLIEWLHSPFVYHVETETSLDMQRLLTAHFCARSSILHYRHLAYGNWSKYLAPTKGDGSPREQVETKKYLYVCRALLAAYWAHCFESIVPVRMGLLSDLPLVPADVQRSIGAMMARRLAGDELGVGPRVPILDQWIKQMLSEREAPDRSVQIPWEDLDVIMLAATKQADDG